MLYYDIDPIRREYIYSLFISHKHLVLDWPRQTGKTLISLACILDYAINNPCSKNIVIGHDNALENLKEKVLRSNQDSFDLIHSHSKYKITLKNDSIIYFNNDIRDEIYDTILIDEQGYVKINPFDFLTLKSKIIANGTRTDSKVFENFVEEFGKIAYVNVYEPDMLPYLRMKKIEKIKDNLL